MKCPVYRSVYRAIDVTTELKIRAFSSSMIECAHPDAPGAAESSDEQEAE